MSEEIQVGDMTYVSSKRASDISGYAQDYIGQLARGGLIDAKRIGGLWYLDMNSLESYKVRSGEMVIEKKDDSVMDDQRQDSALTFDGKEYISARRASKITGYNQDYVGQLARSRKILSHQVGNRWFVDEKGILAHKNEKDSLLASVQAESVGVYNETAKNPEELPSRQFAPEPQLLNYISEEGHLIPQIGKASAAENQHAVANSIPIRDMSLYEMDYQNEVPIHVINKPAFNRNKIPLRPFKPKKDVRSLQRARIPLSVGVLILVLVLVGSLTGVLFISGSTTEGGIQGGLNMTANAITSTSGSTFNKIATIFEGLIDPEIIYRRSN